MIHRYFFAAIVAALLVSSAALTSVAQVGELRGHVWLQQADGQKVPLADANIDVFRNDLKAEYKTKTNKKGEFVFAGLPLVGTYTVAASHPSAQPGFVGEVKVGREIPADLTLSPGDGKRLTFDEIKGAGAGPRPASAPAGGSSSGGEKESAETKAEREKRIKENAEIEAKNKKITESNAVVMKTFTTGNTALQAAGAATAAKNSQEAIAKYGEAINAFNEGLAADPEQPALLTNRSLAYKGRGVEQYNASIKLTDDAAKKTARDAAQADFKAAAESSTSAVNLLKQVPNPTDPAEQQRLNGNKYAAFSANAESLRLLAKVDPTQADAALAAYNDYIGLETDPKKKVRAQLDAGQMLQDAGSFDKALEEYKTILTVEPDNPDANVGAGLALFGAGDKAKYQEAANYLQHFVDVAPEDHKFKADAKAILAELKNTEKVTPEKMAPAKRKRP
jgi:tetratricopeptide (TPR) repeat protein